MKNLREKSRWKYSAMIFLLLIFSSCCSGCAKMWLYSHLKPEGYPSKELSGGHNGALLKAQYCGEKEIKQIRYYSYITTDMHTSCKCNDRVIEILLPTQDSSSEAIFREANEKFEYTDQLAQIYVTGGPGINSLINNSKYYPKVIFVSYPGQYDLNEVTVEYQLPPGGTHLEKVTVDSSHLKWICRSREKYYAYRTLLPLAWVYDAITTPLLIIIAALTYHGP